MILSKSDYLQYLKQDKIALGIELKTSGQKLLNFVSPNPIYVFQKRLRKAEYYKNTNPKGIRKLYYLYLRYLLKKSSIKCGFSIPENVFGPGLAIVHYGAIVVNGEARIGANCRIHSCTNIGASGGKKEAPIIGDNVYIAPGAKIYGKIKIASNSAIGANAVVNKSFDEKGILIAGNPAKKIKKIDIKRIIKHI
jgi:serine O-acetyltransferase